MAYGNGFRRGYASQGGSNRGGGPGTMYQATCGNCGGVALLTFQPTGSRPVLCRDCFRNRGETPRRAPELDRRGTATMRQPVRPVVQATPQCAAFWDAVVSGRTNVVLEANAGCGKTTAIVEGMWRLLDRDSGLKVAAVAFNRPIADELKTRIPLQATAATFHSLGGNAVARWLDRQLDDTFVAGDKVKKYILPNILPPNYPGDLRTSISKIVEQCKNQLLDPRDFARVADLCAEYDIDTGDYPVELFEYAAEAFDASLAWRSNIDYADMIYMALKLCPTFVPKFDYLFVDEAQDLNPSRQQLALLAGNFLSIVGDSDQAIYYFAGSDSRSMLTMRNALSVHGDRGVVVLPLSQTRRCGKVIVAFARDFLAKAHALDGMEHVGEFEALPEAPDGKLCLGDAWGVLQKCICGGHTHRMPMQGDNGAACATCACLVDPDAAPTYRRVPKSDAELAVPCVPQPGDGVLCRVNKDLVTMAYAYIRLGIPVKIQGRDIGANLRALVLRLVREYDTTDRLIQKLETYRTRETQKIVAGGESEKNEGKLQLLNDKVETILALTEGLDSVSDVLARIQSLFEDVKADESRMVVHLSSGHKAKGLEWSRVFVIRPDLIPHPMAKSGEAIIQEYHLGYVMATRPKVELHWHDLNQAAVQPALPGGGNGSEPEYAF